MRISHNGHSLVFTRETVHNIGFFPNSTPEFSIEYVRDGENPLVLFEKTVRGESATNYSYEAQRTGRVAASSAERHVDEFTNYVGPSSSIVYCNKNTRFGPVVLSGICAEKNNCFPPKEEIEEILSKKVIEWVKSLPNKPYMVFQGRADDKFKVVTIGEVGSAYDSTRYVMKITISSGDNFSSDIYTSYSIQNHTLTEADINYIIEFLKRNYESDAFIHKVCNVLLNFAKKLKIRDRLLEDDEGPLSPKAFWNMDLEQVAATIEGDIGEYFKYASIQFEKLTSNTKPDKKYINMPKG